MTIFVQGEVGQVGLDPIVSILHKRELSHACLFVNFKSESIKWAGELERKLTDQLIDVNIIQINGDMDKNEQIAFLRLFTTAVTMKNYNPRVLVATPAANTGINQVLIEFILSVGLPRCLTTLIQERGRNQHHGVYAVLTNWRLFIKLLI